MKWTAEQAAAITSRNENLLVSAAAGSGKTALLIERITRLILEDHIGIDRLLVLTFTKAAAGEMRERLQKALKAAAAGAESPDERRFITRQIAALPDAQISTIHAFCKTIVTDYFEAADVDAGFGMCKDALREKLKDEALTNVFDRGYAARYEQGDTTLTDLLDAYAGARNDDDLKKMVIALYDFKASLADPDGWFEDALARLSMTDDDFRGSFWEKMIGDHVRSEALEARRLLTRGLERTDGIDGFDKIRALLEDEIHQADALLDACAGGYDALFACLAGGLTFKRYPANRQDKPTSDAVKADRDAAKAIVSDLRGLITMPAAEMLACQARMAKPMRDLYALTLAFEEEFAALKREMNVLDYHDLERKALTVLADDTARADLRERVALVFVDEYQDTNALQEAIITQIVRDDNYFMVGDVKQSIYRFRLADPTIFLDKARRFAGGEAPKSRLITLNKNFRSNAAVIDGINAIFEGVMCEAVGEVTYDDDARLYRGAAIGDDPGKVTVSVLERGEDPVDEMEAAYIAGAIGELVGRPIYIAKEGRTRMLEYKDIGVLMRSVKGHGKTFETVLTDAGIPVYFSGGASYFDAPEVQTIMRVIALLANPHDDYSLLSVMLSPIGGFDAEDIARVRLVLPKSPFYQAAEAARGIPGDMADRLRAFFGKIDHFRAVSAMMPPDAFIWYLMSETGYYTAVGALPGGKQRRQNLKSLCALAKDYKATSLYGVFGFADYVRHLRERKYDETQPDTLSESDNVVRVMTIHKSKGLEFPVVFIAGCGRGFNKDNHRERVIMHKDLGLVPQFVDPQNRLRMATPLYEMALNKRQSEALSEEMRLLYVAATRAMARLDIVGTVGSFDVLDNLSDAKASPYRTAHAKSMLDWVLLAAGSDASGAISVCRRSPAEPQKATAEDHFAAPIDAATLSRLLNADYLTGRKKFPGKLGVTDVARVRAAAGGLVNEPERVTRPAFLTAEATHYDGAALGTALHTFMQGIDLAALSKARDNAELEKTVMAEIHRMTEAGMVEAPLAAAVDASRITRFFAFPEKGKTESLGRRLLAADNILREQPFSLRVRANRVREDFPSDETIILQGIMDCVFFDEALQGWVLLDYKTDRVKDRNHLGKLIQRYQPQLMFYNEALAASGRQTAACYLCFLTAGQNVPIT